MRKNRQLRLPHVSHDPPQKKELSKHKPSPDQMIVEGAAHDLNHLLTPPVSLAGFILGQEDLTNLGPQEAMVIRRMAETSETSLARARNLISDLQQIYSTREKEEVHVPPLLEEVVQRAEARKNGFDHELIIDENLPPVQAHPLSLDRVFFNLVLNGVDAMPDGGLLTVAALTRIDKVMVSISDTGVGIPQDVLPHIFEPHFTTKGAGGSGLGLAVVNSIVRAHRGSVAVHSELGKGTTFEVSLPMA